MCTAQVQAMLFFVGYHHKSKTVQLWAPALHCKGLCPANPTIGLAHRPLWVLGLSLKIGPFTKYLIRYCPGSVLSAGLID